MSSKKTSDLTKFSFKKALARITNRLGIKLLCLLMSFLLFLYVRYQKEYTKDYVTKIEIKNIPSRLLIANDIPENITITLKGFKDNIYELPTEFSAYIDLTNAAIGSNMYEVNLAGDIDYSKMNISVNPREIPIILDELSYKTVPIKVPTIGTAAYGLTIDNIIVNPSNTIISGPKALISSIDEIKTYNVDISDKYLDYSSISRIHLPKNIKSDVSRVNINIIFNKNLDKMEFTNIAISIDNLNGKFKINDHNPLIIDKVVLEANKVMLANLSLDDIKLYIDLQDMTNVGIYSNVSVEANVPIYTKLIDIEPSFFDIEIIEREISESNTDESNLTNE
ncbi:YbbR-like domain-containing protein [Brachyspira hyodysenteriae]|uniref:CdaR family protein n=1 Tax=Brachyspira hyodysenteriae TaxID=159 RepID=UPI003A813021